MIHWPWHKNEVVVYVEWHGEYSKDDMNTVLANKTLMARIWLAPRESVPSVYGDDWNDAPWWCNSGSPYESSAPGLRVVELRLGEALP